MVVTRDVVHSTKKRFKKFEKLKCSESNANGEFWDIVILTALDDIQKNVFETQLKKKIENKQIPFSQYYVVSDPPGYKIGNGGSTMVVLEFLFDKFGYEEIKSKKIIIIHAGGFSQRLPNASAIGKAFVAMPFGSPIYQMLEVKLASYIDFPSKMPYGGVFVCCSDTLEVYNDSDIAWTFPATGITGLVHPSTLEIGTTHGVYLLDTTQSIVDGKLIYNTRKFLHKPPVIKMKATDGLVTEVGDGEGVYTDSAYFMSMDAALKVKNFYKKYKPLTCEIDAYGDILQSLGSESDDGYITNTANVVSTTGSLITVRKQVYDWMRNTPFHALALVPNHADTPGTSGVTSHFYHFGTTKEYLELLTEDNQLAEMFGKEVVNFCAGNPYKFLSRKSTEQHATEHVLPSNVQGHVNDSSLAIRLKSAPCIMSSVMLSGVEIGEGSVLEYCRLRECVSIGSCCVVSNCSFKPNAKVPHDTFMHTVSVTRSNTISLSPVGYVTVAFGIHDDLKFSSKTYEAGKNIKYFGKPLHKIFSDSGQAFAGFENKETVSLWKAKLFQIFDTAEESSAMMCEFLESLSQQNEDVHVLQHPDTNLLSMDDILKVKNVENMLHFRCALEVEIIDQCLKASVNYYH